MIVREQQADDYEAIRHVYAEAFRRPRFRPPQNPGSLPPEVALFEALWKAGDAIPELSFTALSDGAVVGHVTAISQDVVSTRRPSRRSRPRGRATLSYACDMSHYIFNVVSGDRVPMPVVREQASRSIRARMWAVDSDERHRDALAPGDLVLLYLGAPERKFIGRAELASAVHVWTPAEGQAHPGDSPAGVLLAQVEEWDPPVPMSAVLSQIDRSKGARADFDAGVVQITVGEYETALAVAAARATSTRGSVV